MSTKKKRDEEKRLKEIAARNIATLEKDAHLEKTGVLLSDEIEFYAKEGELIAPFCHEHLKPASYELTVGDEAMVGGKPYRLSEYWSKSTLRIPAFEVAVIKTSETLNLPRYLIGRWNIRVFWAYKGLVWVGGPQVDPGYIGHLFCPIYNLSNKAVLIRKGDPIAVIDFVKTTPFDRSRGKEKWERYQRPPTRVIIEDYDIDDFRSGPFETKDKLEGVDQKINVFTSLVFVVLAILMTAVALPYFDAKNAQLDIRILDGLTLSFSLIALLLSFFGWRLPRRVKPYAFLALIIALAILAAIISCFVLVILPDFEAYLTRFLQL